MNRTSFPDRSGLPARIRRACWSVCRVSRVPVLLAALWMGLLFTGIPNTASARMPVEYNYYLYVSGGSPANVTNTLYTSGGQTYLVYNNPIAVTLDYQDGHIYDLYGNIIGTILPQGSDNP